MLAHRLIDQRGLHGRRAAEKGMPALDLLRRLARNPAPEDEQGMFVQQPIDLTEDQGLETGEMGPSADPQTPATLAPRKKQSSHRHVHDPDKTARPPPGIDISIREICAFCPGWFNIPDVIVRAYRNGWDRIDLGNAIAYHLGDVGGSLNEGQELLMQQNASKGGKLYLGRTQDQRFDKNDLLKLGRENDMTATNWRYRDHYAVPLGWKDYKQPTHTKDVELSRFREGVVNWPTGEDRLLFTEVSFQWSLVQVGHANTGVDPRVRPCQSAAEPHNCGLRSDPPAAPAHRRAACACAP